MRKVFARDADGEPLIWWHWQNLKADDRRRGQRNSKWFNARAWLHIGERQCIHAEWVAPSRYIGVGVDFRDSALDDVMLLLSLQLGIVGLYVGVERAPWVRRLPGVRWKSGDFRSGLREVEIMFSRIDSPHLSWKLWVNGDDWPLRSWRYRLLSVEEMAFGRPKTTDRVVATGETAVPMPEGAYTATWQRIEYTTRWRRWPRPKVWHRWQIDIEGGIPFPGKGENSWDVGDDATYSYSASALTPSLEAAVADLVRSVMEDRRRYGGPDWKPAKAAHR